MARPVLTEKCEFCDKPAAYLDPLRCHMHYQRSRRGTDMLKPALVFHHEPFERLLAAALAYAEAETERQHLAAKTRIRKAAVAYATAYKDLAPRETEAA